MRVPEQTNEDGPVTDSSFSFLGENHKRQFKKLLPRVSTISIQQYRFSIHPAVRTSVAECLGTIIVFRSSRLQQTVLPGGMIDSHQHEHDKYNRPANSVRPPAVRLRLQQHAVSILQIHVRHLCLCRFGERTSRLMGLQSPYRNQLSSSLMVPQRPVRR